MLQSKVSLTQMGIFSMAAYPYSFKLLWSPIVDSLRWRGAGLRKSWIVPCQLASAALLLSRGAWMQERYEEGDVVSLTALFFVFVLLAATQVGGAAWGRLGALAGQPRGGGGTSTCDPHKPHHAHLGSLLLHACDVRRLPSVVLLSL
jgi:hypothetical protein